MNSIIITPKNEQEYSEIMSFLKKMKVKMKLTPIEEGQFRRMTKREFDDMIEQSLTDVREGRAVSHEDFGKKIEEWR